MPASLKSQPLEASPSASHVSSVPSNPVDRVHFEIGDTVLAPWEDGRDALARVCRIDGKDVEVLREKMPKDSEVY